METMPTVLITGAAQGIGYAAAEIFAENGYFVIINDLDEQLLAEAHSKLSSSFEHMEAIPGDVSDLIFVKNLVDKIDKKFGRLDCLIANAGITAFGEFLEFSAEDFDRVVGLNLKGTFFLVQHSVKLMGRSKSGSIVLMSSVVGHQAHKFLTAYAMSKAALEMMAKNLVIDLSPLGIRINCVAPGATLTERTLQDEEYTNTWSRITPMAKPASSRDIAEACYFLGSNKAGHITGQTLIVDGGWTSVGPSPF